jgi:hypothetical protein
MKPKSVSSLDAKPAAMKVGAKAATKQQSASNVSPQNASTVARMPPSLKTSGHGLKQKAQKGQEEADLDAKSKKPSGGSSSGVEQVELTPGAYSVQGQNMARASCVLLSPQDQAAKNKGGSSSFPFDHGPPVVAGSARAPTPNLVVAAELSTDMEAKIEQEVRRRILSQATKAQIVSVAHGVPMLDPIEEDRRIADLKELHKPRGVKEKLFGDTRNADIDIASSPESIRKRNYLKWTVKRNQATNLWVASVQTSQKAIEASDYIETERSIVSFSATTQEEAFETGLANAVPIMQPFEENPICYVCKAKFALFRRPQHCRNCGVCVCSPCSTTWPGKMMPETYNAKTTNNVCLACDWLAKIFRDALVEGNYKAAAHLYATGNVIIRSPFCLDKKAEAM